jgi:transcriptional regulator with XRE-family HTH domain
MPRGKALTPSASPLHHFGSEVRRAREAAGMTQAELGALVPLDKSAVSRIEAGLTAPDLRFAEVCDEAFSDYRGWFTRFWNDSQSWGQSFPEQFRDYAEFEQQATALWLFEHSYVPGLLQTESYARSVLERHPNVTPDEVTKRLGARLARQAVLDRDGPPLVFVLLDENVLRREIGDAKVMSDQFFHLAELAARPHISIQLLPGTGAHVGLQGAAMIAQTPETTVANLENFIDGVTTDTAGIIATVSQRWDILRSDAYRASESLTKITEAAEQWKP